ncbi:transposase [Burkholderia cepacia]|nr:transposase [Burkholderia cepacia]
MRLIEEWRVEYNTQRTHSSLGCLTPAQFARAHDAKQQFFYLGLAVRTKTGGRSLTPGAGRAGLPGAFYFRWLAHDLKRMGVTLKNAKMAWNFTPGHLLASANTHPTLRFGTRVVTMVKASRVGEGE